MRYEMNFSALELPNHTPSGAVFGSRGGGPVTVKVQNGEVANEACILVVFNKSIVQLVAQQDDGCIYCQ